MTVASDDTALSESVRPPGRKELFIVLQVHQTKHGRSWYFSLSNSQGHVAYGSGL